MLTPLSSPTHWFFQSKKLTGAAFLHQTVDNPQLLHWYVQNSMSAWAFLPHCTSSDASVECPRIQCGWGLEDREFDAFVDLNPSTHLIPNKQQGHQLYTLYIYWVCWKIYRSVVMDEMFSTVLAPFGSQHPTVSPSFLHKVGTPPIFQRCHSWKLMLWDGINQYM